VKATTSKGVKTAKGVKPAKPAKPKVNPNFTAARAAGLPTDVAQALAASPVVVVQLTSVSDPVAQLADSEAKSAAALAGAAYVQVSVDRDGGAVEQLTRTLGKLPDAPSTLVYVRPGTEAATLMGFNDRTVVEQAIADALASLPAKQPAAASAPLPSGVTSA
jgi:hypothetical protein